MRKIKINCKKVFDTGVFYENKAEEIRNLQKELETIESEISNIWNGQDATIFSLKMGVNTKKLNNIIDFLNESASVLKKVSTNHSSVDNEFAKKMNREDIDE